MVITGGIGATGTKGEPVDTHAASGATLGEGSKGGPTSRGARAESSSTCEASGSMPLRLERGGEGKSKLAAVGRASKAATWARIDGATLEELEDETCWRCLLINDGTVPVVELVGLTTDDACSDWKRA